MGNWTNLGKTVVDNNVLLSILEGKTFFMGAETDQPFVMIFGKKFNFDSLIFVDPVNSKAELYSEDKFDEFSDRLNSSSAAVFWIGMNTFDITNYPKLIQLVSYDSGTALGNFVQMMYGNLQNVELPGDELCMVTSSFEFKPFQIGDGYLKSEHKLSEIQQNNLKDWLDDLNYYRIPYDLTASNGIISVNFKGSSVESRFTKYTGEVLNKGYYVYVDDSTVSAFEVKTSLNKSDARKLTSSYTEVSKDVAEVGNGFYFVPPIGSSGNEYGVTLTDSGKIRIKSYPTSEYALVYIKKQYDKENQL